MTRIIEFDCGNISRLVCPKGKKVFSEATSPKIAEGERMEKLDKMAEECGICPEIGECFNKIVFQRQ